jgi:hypothetical protein
MVGELGELFEWIRAAFAGWRFLFSPSYRKTKRNDWENEKTIYIVWDVFCGLAGIIFSLLIIYFVYEAIYRLLLPTII